MSTKTAFNLRLFYYLIATTLIYGISSSSMTEAYLTTKSCTKITGRLINDYFGMIHATTAFMQAYREGFGLERQFDDLLFTTTASEILATDADSTGSISSSIFISTSMPLTMLSNADSLNNTASSGHIDLSYSAPLSQAALDALSQAQVTATSPSQPPFPWPSIIACFIAFDLLGFFIHRCHSLIHLILTWLPALIFYQFFLHPILSLHPAYHPFPQQQQLIQPQLQPSPQKQLDLPSPAVASKRQSILMLFWMLFIPIRIYELIGTANAYSWRSIFILFFFSLLLPELRVKIISISPPFTIFRYHSIYLALVLSFSSFIGKIYNHVWPTLAHIRKIDTYGNATVATL
jgi:hypothetical protein